MFDVQKFLANLEKNLAKEASQDTPEQQFEKAQTGEVVKSIKDTQKAMAKFLSSYKPNISFPEHKEPDFKEVVGSIRELGKTLKPSKIDNTDIITALNSISSDMTKAVSESKTETVSVSNLDGIVSTLERQSKAIDALAKEVKAIKLSPNITVPTPIVNVAETDVKSIVKGLDTVKKAVIEKPTPTTYVATDPLIKFTPADIDDAGAIQYFGYISVGGEWYIRKFDTSVSPKTIRFNFGTGGATAYNTAFTGRAGLTYTLWST
jgi:hypothetical protein